MRSTVLRIDRGAGRSLWPVVGPGVIELHEHGRNRRAPLATLRTAEDVTRFLRHLLNPFHENALAGRGREQTAA